MRFRVFVDGESDAAALPILLSRLDDELGFPEAEWDPAVLRDKGSGCIREATRLTSNDSNVDGIMIVLDGDSEFTACAATAALELASEATVLPFPVAVVVAVQELEAWFLPCITCLAGKESPNRRGVKTALFKADARSPEQPEARRNCKKILTDAMPPGRAYKEMIDAVHIAHAMHLSHAYPENGAAKSFTNFRRGHEFLRKSQMGTYPPRPLFLSTGPSA